MFYIFITFGLDFEILGVICETKDYICNFLLFGYFICYSSTIHNITI